MDCKCTHHQSCIFIFKEPSSRLVIHCKAISMSNIPSVPAKRTLDFMTALETIWCSNLLEHSGLVAGASPMGLGARRSCRGKLCCNCMDVEILKANDECAPNVCSSGVPQEMAIREDVNERLI